MSEKKKGEIKRDKKFFQFEKLDVWKLSVDWADKMMTLTHRIPQNYQYSLGEQIRRAALSVPTNIAEGTGRSGEKEKKQFYNIAKGSVYEVVSLLSTTKYILMGELICRRAAGTSLPVETLVEIAPLGRLKASEYSLFSLSYVW